MTLQIVLSVYRQSREEHDRRSGRRGADALLYDRSVANAGLMRRARRQRKIGHDIRTLQHRPRLVRSRHVTMPNLDSIQPKERRTSARSRDRPYIDARLVRKTQCHFRSDLSIAAQQDYADWLSNAQGARPSVERLEATSSRRNLTAAFLARFELHLPIPNRMLDRMM